MQPSQKYLVSVKKLHSKEQAVITSCMTLQASWVHPLKQISEARIDHQASQTALGASKERPGITLLHLQE